MLLYLFKSIPFEVSNFIERLIVLHHYDGCFKTLIFFYINYYNVIDAKLNYIIKKIEKATTKELETIIYNDKIVVMGDGRNPERPLADRRWGIHISGR